MTLRELQLLLRADLARLSKATAQGEEISVRIVNLLNPRFTPVLLIRLARYCYLSRWLRPLNFLFTWFNVFLFGVECTSKCDIGPGLLLPHTSGTVIGAGMIGANATVFQGVTLGAMKADMGFDLALRPILGDDVIVGAGAKILGGISVGNRARIGANAVVLHPVPSSAVVGGIPAKVLKLLDDDAV